MFAWVGVVLQAVALVAVLFLQRWGGAFTIAAFLALSTAFLLAQGRLPSPISFLVVLAAMCNAGGWAWNWFNEVAWCDEFIHTFTSFAVLPAVGHVAWGSGALDAEPGSGKFIGMVALYGLGLGLLREVVEALFLNLAVWDTVVDLVLDTIGAAIGGWCVGWAIRRQGAHRTRHDLSGQGRAPAAEPWIVHTGSERFFLAATAIYFAPRNSLSGQAVGALHPPPPRGSPSCCAEGADRSPRFRLRLHCHRGEGPRISAQGEGRMSYVGIDLEGRVRERAYFLWEQEGRPEGRAAEHWRMAQVELEAATAVHGTPPWEARAVAKVGEGSITSLAPPRAGKTAAKRKTSAKAEKSADAAPAAEHNASSRQPTEPPERSVRFGDSQRRRPAASTAPRGSRRRK